MSTRIYFDIDGVLADVSKAAEHLTVRKDLARPWQCLNEEQRCAKRSLWKIIEQDLQFWLNLPEVPGIRELLNTALDLVPRKQMFVLSKVPIADNFTGRQEYQNKIAQDKKTWILEHFEEYFEPENVLISFGPKEELAKPRLGDILIDDWASNTDRWNAVGGYGIVFVSTEQAMQDLKQALLPLAA